jgi:hypothetical protein
MFAHEVRNPPLIHFGRFAAHETRLPPGIRNWNRLEKCWRLHRLDHLMESVLSFSRPMENTFVPVDMNLLIKRIVDRWMPRFTRLKVN